MSGKKPIAAGKTSFDLIAVDKFFAALMVAEDAVILDAACGFGAYSLALAPHCSQGRIYAVDLWQEGIARLQDAIAGAGLTNIIPLLSDLNSHLPLADGVVDICLMATVVHDLVQDATAQGALAEVSRVLRPGGILAVVEFKKISGHPGPPIDIRLSPAELNDLLGPHGFTPKGLEIEIGAYNYLALYHHN